MNPQSHTITIHGSQTKYWVYHADQTRTIVAVHGFRGTHLGMVDIIDNLPEYQVIVPDLPGFGRSLPMTQRPHTVEGYADFTIALIQQLNLEPTIMLGHSMGTAVVAEMMIRRPSVASKLILINPIAERPLHGLGLIKMLPGVLYHYLGGILPKKAGQQLLTSRLFFLIGSATMTKTRSRKLRSKIHSNHMNYMAEFHDRDTLLEAYRSSMTNTVTSRANAINVPTLLVAGKIDDIAPIKGQRKLAAALKQARLIELEDVGHIIHYEKPLAAAQAITEFLS